jgi:hypothetical protein
VQQLAAACIIVGEDLCVCPNDVGVQQLAAACIIAKIMHSDACISKLMHSENPKNRINYYINKLLYSIIDMARE